jgi:hypothetical protein
MPDLLLLGAPLEKGRGGGEACFVFIVMAILAMATLVGAFFGAVITVAALEYLTAKPNRIGKISGLAVQNCILAATLVAAVFIGIKQNEINEHLLDLNYYPELAIVYDAGTKQVRIFNYGKSGVLLWGDQLDDEPKDIEAKSYLIAPGSFYYMHGEKLQDYVLKKIGPNGGRSEPFSIFVETENSRKYTVEGQLNYHTTNSVVSVDAQTLAVVAKDWSS